MDNAKIIAMIESSLPQEVLYGKYIHNGIDVPLKPFLEDVLVNFISEGSTYDQVSQYINTKIIPDVIPEVKIHESVVDNGAFNNSDVISHAQNNHQPIENLAPVVSIDEKTPDFQPISFELGKQAIDEFAQNYVGFVSTVRTSEVAVVDAKEFLYSKIPFMNIDKRILIGENYKSIEEVYQVLLNNTYRPATMVDKTELCMFLAEQLEPEVLESTISELNMTTSEYIRTILPNMMINATEVSISGENISVAEVIEKVAQKQKIKLEEQKRKEENAKIEEFNRTSENPSLLSEIKVALDPESNYELTAEIPIVERSLLNPEEVDSLSVLPKDPLYNNDDAYYHKMLGDLKLSIKDANSEHDLSAKEAFFITLSNEVLQHFPTFEMQQLLNSISELIGNKRNEIIKVESNKDEYCDTIMIEINSLTRKLGTADSTDTFSEIKNHITKITRDLVNKNIKDLRVKQALEQLSTLYRKEHTRYNLNKNGFEKQKDLIASGINDKMSSIKRNYISLGNSQDPSLIMSTNMQIEELKGDINQALEAHFLTEDEVASYLREINSLNTLGTERNRLEHR